MLRSNRRIVTIVFLLLMSVTLLASSTYAWFSSNKEVKASGVSVRVSAVNALEISTDGREFSSSITLEDILNADYVTDRYNSVPDVFQPVSTVGYNNKGKIDMYYGVVNTDYDETSSTYMEQVLTAKLISETDGTNGKYLSFDLYFNNLSSRTVYLSNKSSITYDGDDSGIKNAMRVAFVYEGTTESTDIENIQRMYTEDNEYVTIWEPNSNSHTEAGIMAAKSNYGLDISEDFSTLTYYGIRNNITTPVLLTSQDENYFALPNNLVSTPSNWDKMTGENIKLFDFGIGISKIRVYAWVEGQDVDCENMAAGSTFIFNLNFTTNPSAAVR